MYIPIHRQEEEKEEGGENEVGLAAKLSAKRILEDTCTYTQAHIHHPH